MSAQLFYEIADAECAAARRAAHAHPARPGIDFRNVHYPEVAADLERLAAEQGVTAARKLPALWDGTRLHVGLEAIVAALDSLQ